MSKFWKPLHGEYKWNPNGILTLIGSLGIIPAHFVGRYTESFLGSVVFFHFMVFHRPSDVSNILLFQE